MQTPQLHSHTKRADRQRRQGGFTLLEVIISFTLLSIILTLMYAGIRLVVRVGDKTELQLDQVSELRIAERLLRRQLIGALPVALSKTEDAGFGEDENAIYFFEGEEKRMRFVGSMPGHLRYGGIYQQQLLVESSEDGERLTISFGPVNPVDEIDFTENEPVTVLTAKEIRFQYHDGFIEDEAYESQEDSEEWDWQDQWAPLEEAFPAFIRIAAELPKTSTLSWPLFLVSPARQQQNIRERPE